ncbi:MAG: nicotinamide mononucleotide transporter [Acidobacteria bacterium]|nr:MAG: nicotinamide mononucleotide transporter [Acidobacteriota bacterium]
MISLSSLEVFGVLSGAAGVWLAAKENILTWPVGIANNVLFCALFWRSRLYAASCLQLFYIAIAVYGWWRWSHSETGSGTQPIRCTSRLVAWVLVLITASAWAGAYHVLCHYTNSNVPAWDSLTTVLSLTAQYMAGRKLLENWLVWIVANTLNIGLFVFKNLYLNSCLSAFFIVMCVAGYLHWRKTQQRQSVLQAV